MAPKLAIDGGPPVRSTPLPYGRQSISETDITAVTEVLRSDLLTTGPLIERFETDFAERCGAQQAVAVNSGTAALHAAVHAAGAGPGDEVVVPAMTFCATANAVLFEGATPVFADVDPDSLLIDPAAVEALLTDRTRAVIGVDYTGHPCDYERLAAVGSRHDLILIDDASHSLGASLRGRAVGTLADLSTFSFHPVKHITSGEGGMITTDDEQQAGVMRRFRNHEIATDYREREADESWYYEVTGLGWNYRLTDIQSALALSQLQRLPDILERRRVIAATYSEAFRNLDGIEPLTVLPEVEHAWHIYVIKLDLERIRVDRAEVYRALLAEGIGVNVHYIPVHLHPYYRERLGTGPGLCPAAESAYERIITLPLFPTMSESDVSDVIEAVSKVMTAYRA